MSGERIYVSFDNCKNARTWDPVKSMCFMDVGQMLHLTSSSHSRTVFNIITIALLYSHHPKHANCWYTTDIDTRPMTPRITEIYHIVCQDFQSANEKLKCTGINHGINHHQDTITSSLESIRWRRYPRVYVLYNYTAWQDTLRKKVR